MLERLRSLPSSEPERRVKLVGLVRVGARKVLSMVPSQSATECNTHAMSNVSEHVKRRCVHLVYEGHIEACTVLINGMQYLHIS